MKKKVKKIYSPLTALNLVSTYVEYFMYGNVCHPTLEVQYLTHDLPLHQALSNLLPRCKKGDIDRCQNKVKYGRCSMSADFLSKAVFVSYYLVRSHSPPLLLYRT